MGWKLMDLETDQMMPAMGMAKAMKSPKTTAKQSFQFSVTICCQSVPRLSKNASGFSKLKQK